MASNLIFFHISLNSKNIFMAKYSKQAGKKVEKVKKTLDSYTILFASLQPLQQRGKTLKKVKSIGILKISSLRQRTT